MPDFEAKTYRSICRFNEDVKKECLISVAVCGDNFETCTEKIADDARNEVSRSVERMDKLIDHVGKIGERITDSEMENRLQNGKGVRKGKQ